MITDDPTCPICDMPVRMHTATFAKVCLHEICQQYMFTAKNTRRQSQ